jgi:hypothetical protein
MLGKIEFDNQPLLQLEDPNLRNLVAEVSTKEVTHIYVYICVDIRICFNTYLYIYIYLYIWINMHRFVLIYKLSKQYE